MLDGLRPSVRRLNAAYRSVFSGPLGELVLADILREGNVGGAFLPVPHNPGMLPFQEGRRSMSVYIAGKVNLNRERLLELAQPQTQNQENDDG